MFPHNPVPNYDFLVPQRTIFGWGRWPEVGPAAAQLGNRVFLVLGSRHLAAGGFVEQMRVVLDKHRVELIELTSIAREPEVGDVDAAAKRIREQVVRPGDIVMGVGGGSALDLAKAVAALATNLEGSGVQDYLEGVGRGYQLKVQPLPIIAMPTTAGTGSEATKNAVISSYDPPFKKSLRSDGLVPRLAIVDPQLTVSVSPTTTAHGGMDAITQLIESYISRKARPIPRALALEGLRQAIPAIVEAVADGSSRAARESMAHAALLSGMALANSGLGMAHGVAAALGVHFRVPHGLACAVMLPAALRANRAVSQRDFAEIARAIGIEQTDNESAMADALVDCIERICEQVNVNLRLSELGVTHQDLPALVRDSRGNSMDGNPRVLSDADLLQILEARL